VVARTDVESLFIQRNLFHFGIVCFLRGLSLGQKARAALAIGGVIPKFFQNPTELEEFPRLHWFRSHG
jgi:hypothetical protein